MVFALLTVFSLVSCGNKKSQPVMQEERAVDTLELFADEPDQEEELFKEEEVSELVNEFFDDFIFGFVQDKELQMSRIIFPLPYHAQDSVHRISQEEWEYDNLFLSDGYYTVILDNEEELDQLGDTAIHSAQVERAYLEERFIKKFFFEKVEGRWILEGVSLYNFDEQQKNDFYTFYHRFATDSLYQAKHVHSPLRFITADPDDDFEILEATLDLNQWFAFKPELPEKWLTNIIYGRDHVDESSTQKILQLKGMGNGFVNTLFFHQRKGKWELYQFEDINN